MGLFEVSGFCLLAIGKTIIHSLWIGLLILALLRLTLAYIPAKFSDLRYSISVFALLLLCTSILTTFFLLFDPGATLELAFNSAGTFPSASGKLFMKSSAAVQDSSVILSLCGYIYIAGVLIMLFRSLFSLAYIRKLQSSATLADQEWQLIFSRLSTSLGIKRSVKFLLSTRATGPMLVGYLKPAVIVPAGMITMLPVTQIETILLHELYHLKRRDYLINVMQLIFEGLLFYNPAVWIISALIRNEREHCCDDQVLKATDNPINYAKALIHIAEQQQFTRLAPGAVGSRKQDFHFRIKRIINYNTMKTNMRDKVLSLALLAGSIIVLLSVSGFRAEPGFIKFDKSTDEGIVEYVDPFENTVPDTIPEELEEIEEPDWEEIEFEHEQTLIEIEEPDWEEIEFEHEQALKEIEEIDWEAMKAELEAVKLETLEEIEEIDWNEVKAEMQESFAQMKLDMKEIKEIEWEEVRVDMEQSLAEMKLDMAEVKIEIEDSMNEINWDEIRIEIKEDLENVKLSLDSIRIEMDL